MPQGRPIELESKVPIDESKLPIDWEKDIPVEEW